MRRVSRQIVKNLPLSTEEIQQAIEDDEDEVIHDTPPTNGNVTISGNTRDMAADTGKNTFYNSKTPVLSSVVKKANSILEKTSELIKLSKGNLKNDMMEKKSPSQEQIKNKDGDSSNDEMPLPGQKRPSPFPRDSDSIKKFRSQELPIAIQTELEREKLPIVRRPAEVIALEFLHAKEKWKLAIKKKKYKVPFQWGEELSLPRMCIWQGKDLPSSLQERFKDRLLSLKKKEHVFGDDIQYEDDIKPVVGTLPKNNIVSVIKNQPHNQSINTITKSNLLKETEDPYENPTDDDNNDPEWMKKDKMKKKSQSGIRSRRAMKSSKTDDAQNKSFFSDLKIDESKERVENNSKNSVMYSTQKISKKEERDVQEKHISAEKETEVNCPICNLPFSGDRIEVHATNCANITYND